MTRVAISCGDAKNKNAVIYIFALLIVEERRPNEWGADSASVKAASDTNDGGANDTRTGDLPLSAPLPS
jgi:hypothetical protein